MDGSAIRTCPRQSTPLIFACRFSSCYVLHMQPALDPLSADRLELVPDAEVVAVLAEAIRDGRSDQMTRLTATYLAGVCAAYLAGRLAVAGLVVVRQPGRVDVDGGFGPLI